jgi:hypothetical protein
VAIASCASDRHMLVLPISMRSGRPSSRAT